MRRLFWLFGLLHLGACLRGVPDNLGETLPIAPVPEPVLLPDAVPDHDQRPPGPLSFETRRDPNDESEKRLASAATSRDGRRRLTAAQLAEDLAVVSTVFGDKIKMPAEATNAGILGWTLTSQLGADHACVRAAGLTGPCPLDRSMRPVFVDDPAVQLADPEPGIVRLTVHDLTGRWTGLSMSQLARLRAATGIVVDLRDAHGNDPRPLIPWLEQVTGRAPLRPLRSVTQLHDAGTAIAAYDARFAAVKRDPEVWNALVGEMPAATSHTTPVITVLVGWGCDAACELAARVLETYAGARVYGAVFGFGNRLGHDDPARLELPHSKIAIHFYATTYELSAEIEKATRATDEWPLALQEYWDATKLEAFAVADVRARLNGGWPRCDTAPYYRWPAQAPAAVSAKILKGEPASCPDGYEISVRAFLPREVFDTVLTSCGMKNLPVGGSTPNFTFDAPTGIPFGALAQVAANPFVQRIAVACIPRVYEL